MKKISLKSFFLAAAVLWLGATAHADDSPVLLERQGVQLSEQDLLQLVKANVPAEERARLLGNEERLRDFIAQAFATRLLAAEGAERELAADEQWQLDNARERTLAQLQLNHLVGQQLKPDYRAEAHEFYLANPEKFTRPERVRAEHILIGTAERTEAEARARAAEVVALLRAGEQSFEALAREYSDDDSAARNGGDLGFFGRGQMVKPFEQAAFALRETGDLAEAVATPFGVHIIRLKAREAARTLSFEEVREVLEQEQRAEARKRLIMREYERIGSLPGIEVDQDAIKALVARQGER